jgi:hypothetical protein
MSETHHNMQKLLQDESLTPRQQRTVNMMYQHYGKRMSSYMMMVVFLGWLGAHRFYLNKDTMGGLLCPLGVLWLIFVPIALLSGSQPMLMGAGIAAGLLYGIALLEVPFHLMSIKKQNRALLHFLEDRVKS